MHLLSSPLLPLPNSSCHTWNSSLIITAHSWITSNPSRLLGQELDKLILRLKNLFTQRKFTFPLLYNSFDLQDELQAFMIATSENTSAFSKRFVGAGHSEEGGGPGGEGTLPSAHRACTYRGVWGHSPSEIFWNLDSQRCHLVRSGRILSVKIVFHLHNSIYHHFQ